jgi:hypothetical protein
LHLDQTSGRYTLEMPRELPAAARGKKQLQLQVVARRYRDAARQTLDDWFLRLSATRTIEIALPFVTWADPAERVTKIPLLARAVRFGAVADSRAAGYPSFDTPPRLKFQLEKLDEGSGKWAVVERRITEPVVRGGEVGFQWNSALRSAGQYRYHYELEGTTRQGLITIRSSPKIILVRFGWEYVVGALLALLVLVTLLLARAARLNGPVVLVEPDDDYAADSIRSAKEYRSESLDALSGGGLGTGHCFRLRPRRILIWKIVRLEMLRGQAILEPEGKTLVAGAVAAWRPGLEHRLRFDRTGDDVRVVISIKAGLG